MMRRRRMAEEEKSKREGERRGVQEPRSLRLRGLAFWRPVTTTHSLVCVWFNVWVWA
jgi:hypothetical protein